MLPQLILDKILAKYGKERIYSSDCLPLAQKIGVSETTVKRMFGLVGADSPERNRTPHTSTMDILAKWLGYGNYDVLLRDIGESGCSSEFTTIESINASTLHTGTRIKVTYEPSREIVMAYLGDNEFLITESKNSKIVKGDRIRLTTLVLGQELLVSEVIRDGKSLGAYRGAKDGGLTSFEIIESESL